jgi:polyisoprenoid-binding protein YceI
MRSLLLTTIMTLTLTSTAQANKKLEAGKYNVDTMHSSVLFEIPHLVISTVEGKFKTYSGAVVIDSKFNKSSLEAEVDVSSIDTAVTDRDNHLKSPDFFDVAKYPKMKFKSTAITGTDKAFKVTGDLTIRDVTKKVTFSGAYKGTVTDGYGNTKAAFVATTKINRQDFGLKWSNMVEAGPVVGDEVTITLKIQAAKEAAKK